VERAPHRARRRTERGTNPAPRHNLGHKAHLQTLLCVIGITPRTLVSVHPATSLSLKQRPTISKAERLADRLGHELQVAAWLRDAAADDLVPPDHLAVAIADHARELKQLQRLARSL